MILPLEQQVCSLKSAKRLKELGCVQESLFYWQTWIPNEYSGPMNRKVNFGWPLCANEKAKKNVFSAYTVAELGELLPVLISGKPDKGNTAIYRFNCDKVITRWQCRYGNYLEMRAGTEAESRAKMLIYLYENNLITGQEGK